MAHMKITPVLFVDSIEEALPFWVDSMGFTKTVEVPEGDHLGFVILNYGEIEVMLQSIASVNKDIPAFAPTGPVSGSSLFIEVDDFADTLQRLAGYPIAMPERTTFYGMREIGVRAPGGHIVLFAARC
jgi:uncharacterized glyoxalase superfamily protein PhnB